MQKISGIIFYPWRRLLAFKRRMDHPLRRAALWDVLHVFKKRPSLKKMAVYRQHAKVYDVFTFFNELDLLEIRMNILYPSVDYFVIVECTETFSGKPKPLYYAENKERFAKFQNKIIHHVTTDAPKDADDLRQRLQNPQLSDLDRQIITDALTSDNVPKDSIHWLKEFYQKESIKKALVGLADDDICFVSDVDEIWNPEVRLDFSRDVVYRLRQDAYAYYVNNRSAEPWAGVYAIHYGRIKNNCLNHLRTPGKTKHVHVRNGGWHFTNLGGAEKIQEKIESYGHQEYNNEEIKSQIAKRIQANEDFIGRGYHFWIDESRLPAYLLEHKAQYVHLFKAETPDSSQRS